MLSFFGSSALSTAQIGKLNSKCHAIGHQIEEISSRFVHFVQTNRLLSHEDRVLLKRLLTYGTSESSFVKKGFYLLIVPRIGTISPWSSKATDIAHNCGLSSIQRIERGREIWIHSLKTPPSEELLALFHDPMTESVLYDQNAANLLFKQQNPAPVTWIPVLKGGVEALQKANIQLGLALDLGEIEYLVAAAKELNRDLTDVELMMFAQANSEHCRHKIFNASWTIDDKKKEKSLFQMIRNTYNQHPKGVLSAYNDNAAVMKGSLGKRFFPDAETNIYSTNYEEIDILMKVETHNHPTAISPFPGAATGSGGEIRDEGAVGQGSKPKAGLTGFSVSHLRFSDKKEPWENDNFGKPQHIASPLQIMLEAPIGGAAFNNEFGRPNLAGYFRVFENQVAGPDGPEMRGYHKPIMIAGGFGNIRREHIQKQHIKNGSPIIVLGGPAMLIGLGGGAASSVGQGTANKELDYASVQRANPELERRCQEVIDRCCAYGKNTPILSIHDVGAGGLSNAVPEIIEDAKKGGIFELRTIQNDEPGMSPKELWCNESQERYVLAIDPKHLERFEAIAKRERCPYAKIGHATAEQKLIVTDEHFKNTPIELPLDVLFGKPPKMHRKIRTFTPKHQPFDASKCSLRESAERVIRFPTVADKSFLITIGDRSITGMVARDQMVGPWQVPVADVAVTTADYFGFKGEAMAIGERPPIAILDGSASARMAVGEAITNLAAASIQKIQNVRLSANWMVSAGKKGEDSILFETVQALAMDFCPKIGVSIPVGKDSMSMRSSWSELSKAGEISVKKEIHAPLSLIITGFAPVSDVRLTLTPVLQPIVESTLLYVDLGFGKNRLGGSVLAQVYGEIGATPPDIDPESLAAFFKTIQRLNQEGMILAYHDRSDGGLFVTLLEMAFAGNTGLNVDLREFEDDPHKILFSEELGAVIQVLNKDLNCVMQAFEEYVLDAAVYSIGHLTTDKQVHIQLANNEQLNGSLVDWRVKWSEVSWKMQRLRDDPTCANEAYYAAVHPKDGLQSKLSFDPKIDIISALKTKQKPRVAILREQGVNGQLEMAAAFKYAGFEAEDVHMSDILSGKITLESFQGMVACGGFSYGDVLGAGGGWAKSILFSDTARTAFSAFFVRKNTFSLGVCNGCQMLSALHELIPGAENWPTFVRNRSEQFEARTTMVKIQPSPSIFFKGMENSILPIAVAHGEGRVLHSKNKIEPTLKAIHFVEADGSFATQYPANPNGSPDGLTGLTTKNGRVTIMMPHPERVFRAVTNSWIPKDWGSDGPWLRMFRNARIWAENNK